MNPAVSPASFEWLTDNQSLSQTLAQFSHCLVCLDTEFIRRTTYWPKPALIQIRVEQKNWLIDPLTIDNWQPLHRLLEDKSCTKVLHSGSEDLQLLWKLTGTLPTPYYDTQIAHALLSESPSISYNHLVQELLAIEFEDSCKQLQTSDWLLRPLSELQCIYATKDVDYLEEIHQKQLDLFAQHPERIDWHEQICQQKLQQTKQVCSSDGSLAYLGIKGVNRIASIDSLKRLQLLAQWRDLQAKQRDLVRSYLLSDGDMLTIAQSPPSNPSQWRSISTGRSFQKKSDIAILQKLIAQAKHLAEPQRPTPMLPKKLGETYKRMVAEKKRIAQELGISDQILASKKDLQEFLLSRGKQRFAGWRDQLLHEPMLKAIQQTEV